MGEVFAGRYELVDPIGRGGVGAVWRAWDHRRRRYVAAKVLQQSDAHTLLRFVREQALRIEHPHVLAPASWAADDDQVLFTMDLVSGGSLAHVIGDYGPLPPRFVCTLLDQLLAGLSTVHAEGVVHRDIKPANILMEATGRGRPHLRLSDFGISMRKGEPRLTETNYVVGTLGYFAPEQMMGAEPDFPADLFAVGLVALYLLQGTKPDSQALIEHFAEHGTPSAPDGVPEPLWQVIAGLLQPDPQDRFRTATGARKALNAAVEMLPEPSDAEEPVEVFDQIGPLPEGFGPDGPLRSGGPAAAHSPGPQTSGQPTAPPSPQQAPAPQPTAPLATGPHPSGQQPQPYPSAPAPMSETGSFHLPPPGPAVPAHHAPHTAAPAAPYGYPQPAGYTAPDANPVLAPAPGPQDRSFTHPYTAPQQGTAPFQAPASAPGTRPGPSPRVAVPVLLVALVCFAVGIWALTQS
ncbi:protein kinase [Streptomyces sp. NBC_00523]|uniref:serine/threonine protein kinase n=1 Tax=unclassified Streptomyces TaxID=2593676 RepID=UPI002E80A062|nr:protein kinase [Streptomyces sp. NBC_00523]WUD01160.1 protein kinase [Streptomyces sp. NBC_00523]